MANLSDDRYSITHLHLSASRPPSRLIDLRVTVDHTVYYRSDRKARVVLPTQEVLSVDSLLTEASKRSQNYDWAAAADLWAKALEKLNADSRSLEEGGITELLAKAQFSAAFQAKSRDEFEEKMQLAEAAYARACAAYATAGSEPLATRSKARGLFATFWLEGKTVHRRIIDKCIGLSGSGPHFSMLPAHFWT